MNISRLEPSAIYDMRKVVSSSVACFQYYGNKENKKVVLLYGERFLEEFSSLQIKELFLEMVSLSKTKGVAKKKIKEWVRKPIKKELFTLFRVAIAIIGAIGYFIASRLQKRSNLGKGLVLATCFLASLPSGMLLLSGILLSKSIYHAKALYRSSPFSLEVLVNALLCFAGSYVCLDQYHFNVFGKERCKLGVLEATLLECASERILSKIISGFHEDMKEEEKEILKSVDIIKSEIKEHGEDAFFTPSVQNACKKCVKKSVQKMIDILSHSENKDVKKLVEYMEKTLVEIDSVVLEMCKAKSSTDFKNEQEKCITCSKEMLQKAIEELSNEGNDEIVKEKKDVFLMELETEMLKKFTDFLISMKHSKKDYSKEEMKKNIMPLREQCKQCVKKSIDKVVNQLSNEENVAVQADKNIWIMEVHNNITLCFDDLLSASVWRSAVKFKKHLVKEIQKQQQLEQMEE